MIASRARDVITRRDNVEINACDLSSKIRPICFSVARTRVKLRDRERAKPMAFLTRRFRLLISHIFDAVEIAMLTVKYQRARESVAFVSMQASPYLYSESLRTEVSFWRNCVKGRKRAAGPLKTARGETRRNPPSCRDPKVFCISNIRGPILIFFSPRPPHQTEKNVSPNESPRRSRHRYFLSFLSRALYI